MNVADRYSTGYSFSATTLLQIKKNGALRMSLNTIEPPLTSKIGAHNPLTARHNNVESETY